MHHLAVVDMYRRDRAGLQRLDHLAAARRDDPAAGGGHHIHLAEAGPADRAEKQRHQAQHSHPGQGRRRSLHNLQRRGQEVELLAGTASEDGIGLAGADQPKRGETVRDDQDGAPRGDRPHVPLDRLLAL